MSPDPKAFAPLGLVRGEQRAKATREAYARRDAPPPPRRHVRTREWREKEDLRLMAEGTALLAAQAEQQRKAAEDNAALEADRARLAEQAAEQDAALVSERAAIEAARTRQQRAATEAEVALQAERARLAEQAAEQDAVVAGAEALGMGLIDPVQDVVMLAPAKSDDPATAQIITRINKSPSGWRRFVAAMTPGWQRMRQAAAQEAEAKLAGEKAQVADDRKEIESVWQKLAAMTGHLLPKDASVQSAREQVARVLAQWRFTKDREPTRRNPARRDD